MTKLDFAIAGGPLIISITEKEDGTREFEIPGMHIDPDLDEWVFDEEQSDTTASGTGVESTKLDGEGSTPSSGATDSEEPT